LIRKRKPNACIALGSFSSKKGSPRLTKREYSFGSLEAQIRELQAVLQARPAEAKISFLAANPN
jgi:hypothetical protein